MKWKSWDKPEIYKNKEAEPKEVPHQYYLKSKERIYIQEIGFCIKVILRDEFQNSIEKIINIDKKDEIDFYRFDKVYFLNIEREE